MLVSVFYFSCKRNKIYTTGYSYIDGDAFRLVHHACFLHTSRFKIDGFLQGQMKLTFNVSSHLGGGLEVVWFRSGLLFFY